MRRFLIFTGLSTILTLFSCSLNPKIGDWDDIIKLSTKDIVFDVLADSTVVTTKGDWWWIDEVTLDSKVYFINDSVDIESDNYSIKLEYFYLEKIDNNTIFFKVDENPTSLSRNITVGFEAGDYFDSIKITQNGN